ncbi:MAG: hypothetical protein KDA61_20340, partial [Planctomycetales bacterium]|nr:hypothetical protein [Planctomycetales bacterium]
MSSGFPPTGSGAPPTRQISGGKLIWIIVIALIFMMSRKPEDQNGDDRRTDKQPPIGAPRDATDNRLPSAPS